MISETWVLQSLIWRVHSSPALAIATFLQYLLPSSVYHRILVVLSASLTPWCVHVPCQSRWIWEAVRCATFGACPDRQRASPHPLPPSCCLNRPTTNWSTIPSPPHLTVIEYLLKVDYCSEATAGMTATGNYRSVISNFSFSLPCVW